MKNYKVRCWMFGEDSKQFAKFHPTSVGLKYYTLEIMVQGLCGAITSLSVQLSFCGLS